METAENQPQSFKRRDFLREIEKEVQQMWKTSHTHEGNPKPNTKKFFTTFPYPYMNGRIHLGHGFSFSKNEFISRYKRLKGYNVLWPFSYHCTGMPICASANKLKSELSKFSLEELEKKMENRKIQEKEFAAWHQKKKETEAEELKKNKANAKKGGNKNTEEKKANEAKNVEAAPVVEKPTQYDILRNLGIKQNEIHPFVEPNYWLKYFSPRAQEDLLKYGVHVDHRRSFITTDLNPYYNKFIEWQFRKLKEGNYISFGKRPSIYSIKDKQMCADHDRASGEGVTPQEYTLIKLEVLEIPKEIQEAVQNYKVFLVAATLRPETMYGQTNCWALPTGVYGAYLMKNNEVYICSDRAALNLAYQEATPIAGEVKKLVDVPGQMLMGLPLKAPLSKYEKVYCLPMMTISMEKGTGIVTSVPSDSPDDYAALMDLKKKEALVAKYSLKKEMIEGYEPVPIIDTPGYGNLSAVTLCTELKVQSQNEKEKLQLAKEKIYLKGFYEGVLLVGDYAGEKVQKAKPLVRAQLMQMNGAAVYYEPENKVVSRTGDNCIVAYCDQWYLKYGEKDWKEKVASHIKSNNFETYNPTIQKSFEETIEWLKEWGCSRSFGTGTRLPWDNQFLIESLSDSTIYMAFYTISHYLQGDIFGETPGTLGIKAEEIADCDFDYIYLKKNYSPESKIPQEKLDTMKNEFLYWYPMDLRTSGKDLISNHLTMSLYNHAAIWKDYPELWTRGYFCNGWILVDGEKMSKSLGNFITIADAVDQYGTDATRLALADAGDSLDDANFVRKEANNNISNLYALHQFILLTIESLPNLRESSIDASTKYFDDAFAQQLLTFTHSIDQSYNQMRFRDVLRDAFYELMGAREDYKILCGSHGFNKKSILEYMKLQLIVLYPIAPHMAEYLWYKHVAPALQASGIPRADYVHLETLPDVQIETVNSGQVRSLKYIKDVMHNLRLTHEKVMKGKKIENPKKIVAVIAEKYSETQEKVLVLFNQSEFDEKNSIKVDWKKIIRESMKEKTEMEKALMFGSMILEHYKTIGKSSLELKTPYNEKEVLELAKNLIKKEFKVEEMDILTVEQAKALNKPIYTQAATHCTPGKPQLLFDL